MVVHQRVQLELAAHVLDSDGALFYIGDESVHSQARAPPNLFDELNGLGHRLVVRADEDGLLGLVEHRGPHSPKCHGVLKYSNS